MKSSGWAGFGISPNGDMENSNVILFWMNSDGTSNFTERNTNGGKVTPTINTKQLWFPLLTKTQDGYLISKSTRKIKLCDTTGQHKDIDAGTPHVIYSWGSNFVSGDAAYHGTKRSTKSLPLISSLNSAVNLNMSQITTTDFRVNVNVKNFLRISHIGKIFPGLGHVTMSKLVPEQFCRSVTNETAEKSN